MQVCIWRMARAHFFEICVCASVSKLCAGHLGILICKHIYMCIHIHVVYI